ncbi:MAG: recombination mediator RecR [Candidatus Shapirobacteria bacterium]|jgi:recombination protein RecR
MVQFPKALRDLITGFERLPGIGPKSATRLAFYLLNTPASFVVELAQALINVKKDIKVCKKCFSVSEEDECVVCLDEKRDHKLVCVVERAIDMMALENMGGYRGVYHVLGGVINPLDHVGPDDLKIDELLARIDGVEEVIIATNSTMEGEATALYIKRKIEERKSGLKISRIGSGLPMGADLEFADQATLSRAMEGRREI